MHIGNHSIPAGLLHAKTRDDQNVLEQSGRGKSCLESSLYSYSVCLVPTWAGEACILSLGAVLGDEVGQNGRVPGLQQYIPNPSTLRSAIQKAGTGFRKGAGLLVCPELARKAKRPKKQALHAGAGQRPEAQSYTLCCLDLQASCILGRKQINLKPL